MALARKYRLNCAVSHPFGFTRKQIMQIFAAPSVCLCCVCFVTQKKTKRQRREKREETETERGQRPTMRTEMIEPTTMKTRMATKQETRNKPQRRRIKWKHPSGQATMTIMGITKRTTGHKQQAQRDITPW